MALTYSQSGVNYDALDAFKRACQQAAAATTGNLKPHGFKEPSAIRGESAYLIETPTEYLAHVEEALGTKTLVADAYYKLTGKSLYRNVALDNVSTIVNDLCSCGALPVSVAMYLAVGDGAYLADPVRARDLAEGFAEGCRQAGAVWSGGETQALKGMVEPSTAILGGSALGRIFPKDLRVANELREGDAIVMLGSSGVQTNGLTLCRALAERLPKGYLTDIGGGETYAEALLAPSVIYVKFVAACQKAGLNLHYLSHVTGHGWRKLMRLDQPWVYVINKIPEAQPVFRTIQAAAELDAQEMYGTFNMGAGFAAYVAREDGPRCVELAEKSGYRAWLAGEVQKDGARKAVVIEPLKLTYGAETLHIR